MNPQRDKRRDRVMLRTVDHDGLVLDAMTPTRQQQRVLAAVRSVMLDSGSYEIKQWEVSALSPTSRTLVLLVVRGFPNDEGTLNEVFGRDRAHLFIGPRGGIRTYIGSTSRRISVWQVPHLSVYERKARKRKKTKEQS